MLCNALPALVYVIVPYSSLESTYFSEITLESICEDVWLQSVLARKHHGGKVLAWAVVYHDLSPLLRGVHYRIPNAFRSQADGSHSEEEWMSDHRKEYDVF